MTSEHTEDALILKVNIRRDHFKIRAFEFLCYSVIRPTDEGNFILDSTSEHTKVTFILKVKRSKNKRDISK